MSTIDEGYYQNDCVRVMAEITKQLASDIGGKIQPQQEALDAAEATLAALDAAGETAPADLQAKTDEYVQAVRDGYEAAKAQADADLALPADIQAALNINVPAATECSSRCQQWLDAIDLVWTPGGST
jgi:hypothetical protein